jgi:lipoate-protein ligase A
MAADMYLWESCARSELLTVRLYQWDPASITIGCMQDAGHELDFIAMKKNGIAWIRRPTGGRAVLHEADTTYSCIFSSSIPEMGKSIMETYGIISQCLIKGLGLLNINCTTCDTLDALRGAKGETKLPCFLAPNRNEIMVNGKKLVGSAQKRGAGAVLQHGSIPLTDAYRTLPDYLSLSDDRRKIQNQLLKDKSICISEILPNFTLLEIRQALKQGFSANLPFEVEERQWSPEELQATDAIAASEEFRRQFMEIGRE